MTTLPIPDAGPAQPFDWRAILNKLGPIIGLLFVFLLFTILVPLITGRSRFATTDNFELMLRLTAVVGTAAIGMTLIIISGGIDLSAGPVIALTTVIIALLLQQGYSATIAAAGGVAAASFCGLITSQLITRLKLPPFIATLGMWAAVRGAAKGFANNSTVYPPNSWRSTWLHGLLQTLPQNKWWLLVPAGVWLMIILATLIALMLRYTRLGRHIIAVGSNEQTARLCGIRVERIKLIVYVLGAAFAGLAGILEFSYISSGDPTTRSGAELDIIAAVFIGGASISGGHGSIFGSLIGALMMNMVGNGCTKLGWPNWVQEIATGVIIIIAVALDRLRHPPELKG
ncbi:MAG TPA: ABC transporter permease [Tepidisphaeraceae bacterium]|jgi:ribose/xylose/arabinose/galactoside ABC-type transport system permease subunit|nr:ABC transporter permease [Tepidisphaeraceae bacterium]